MVNQRRALLHVSENGAFAAPAPGDMPSVATRIAIELRNQYILGDYPWNKARDGKYRDPEVGRVFPALGLGSPLRLRWRLGYRRTH